MQNYDKSSKLTYSKLIMKALDSIWEKSKMSLTRKRVSSDEDFAIWKYSSLYSRSCSFFKSSSD